MKSVKFILTSIICLLLSMFFLFAFTTEDNPTIGIIGFYGFMLAFLVFFIPRRNPAGVLSFQRKQTGVKSTPVCFIRGRHRRRSSDFPSRRCRLFSSEQNILQARSPPRQSE